ncbi:MAG: ZPR1 zinc finger domain-containing protein [Candidatus Thorarchaeota archaeon]|nr:MAG: ZPR1 zinc finger domain-containing protein [Candidatus Thorarchaeota archaeon]
MTEDLSVTCPSCEEGLLDIKSILYSVPYFNELAMFTMTCPKCNFSHNDVFSAEQRPPMRRVLNVDRRDLMQTRVVRSGSGTIRMPDFGIDVEPGPNAESFISNIEGVLQRTISVVETAIRFAETDGQREEGTDVLELLQKAVNGEMPFTLIIEDPAGVSAILPDNLSLVSREELTKEEASRLKGAPAWLEVARQDLDERKG